MTPRSLLSRIWYRSFQAVLEISWVMVYHVRRTGVENIPATGGVLLVSNHQSHFDPPLVGTCCPRRTSCIARETLFKFTPFAWFIRSLGAFPIDREGSGLAGIKETLRLLKRGEVVLIFPEGTRTPNGEIRPFQQGFTTLAVRSGAAIVPVAVEGAFDVWPRWRRLPGRGTIHVHFGPPLMPDEIRRFDQDELAAEVERRVRQCHARVRAHPAFAQPAGNRSS
jgi:1-acyl-sn-glycerol-3-phosphate acyltransferase